MAAASVELLRSDHFEVPEGDRVRPRSLGPLARVGAPPHHLNPYRLHRTPHSPSWTRGLTMAASDAHFVTVSARKCLPSAGIMNFLLAVPAV